MSEEHWSIPSSWEWTPLESIAEISPKLPYEIDDEVDVSFIPMKRVEEETGRINLSETRKYGKVKGRYTKFIDNDIIFAKITPCMENGKVAILKNLINGVGFGSTEFHVLRLREESLSNQFYYYFLLQKWFRDLAMQHFTGTVGHRRVPTNFMKEVFVPVAPSNEQVRIVRLVEELLSRIEAGVQGLQAAQTKLEQYRQTILKQAYTGKLTQKWRNNHERNLSHLERVNGLDQHPGWQFRKLVSISIIERGKFSHRPRNEPRFYGGEYPFIQTGDISNSNGRIKTYKQTLNDDGIAISKKFPKGTIVMSIAANIGDTAILEIDAWAPDSVVGITPDQSIVNSEYIEYYLRTIKQSLESNAPATAQKNINLRTLRPLLIPVAPIKEQKEIVRMVDLIISNIDYDSKSINMLLIQKMRLKQSILRRAFEGCLVPQDPRDEPAGIILDRIKTQIVKKRTLK